MEGLKQWAFSVCAAMVACGICRMLIPSSGMEKMFRTTVSVFFLCCLLSPMVFQVPALRIELENDSQQQIQERAERLQSEAENQAGAAANRDMMKIIGEKLDQMGIKYHGITININENGQSLSSPGTIEILLSTDYERQQTAVRGELADAFGLDVELQFTTGG